MLEEFGDFWIIQGDARCITTNGALRSNGYAVMGKGIALQAKQRYPRIEASLGRLIQKYGNHVFKLDKGLISFPTKHHWKDETSDIGLIKRSAQELVFLLKDDPAKRVLLTRPGCGNGNLHWSGVGPFIQNILSDDKFIVINRDNFFRLKDGTKSMLLGIDDNNGDQIILPPPRGRTSNYVKRGNMYGR